MGASRGIGKGLVLRHAEAGWEVAATTRNGAPLEATAPVDTYQLDVRSADELRRLISELPGPVDRLIHNAGVMRAPRAELMAVNAEAPIRVVEAMLAESLINQGGTIAIMTSQMGARKGRSGTLGDYGDSKAALNDEFRKRASAWAEHGVTAVVIHPGWVRTDMGGAGATLSVDESVTGIMQVLDDLDAGDHGKFLTWDGRVHPW